LAAEIEHTGIDWKNTSGQRKAHPGNSFQSLIYNGEIMNICFIGGGNMASALIGGLLKRGFAPAHIRVVEVSHEACTRLHNEYGVIASTDLAAGVSNCEFIVLAVKPQQLHDVALQLAPILAGQLIISIAAGIRAADLKRWLGTKNIVRAMPNTPALIRSGITGLYALPGVSAAHRHDAQTILSAVGSTLWLESEAMMDAVTAVSGSGPAYVFYFIEAMQQAALELGFNPQDARRLVLDTFIGASKLVEAGNEEVDVLRARVTSKNGTTERAILSMEASQVKQHIVRAVHAAAARSAEMGAELGAK
jgi:pyrroline-5-carboxylate reductase